MTTFTVWKYDDPARAQEAEDILRSAAGEGLVTIHDSATVSWAQGDERPETHHRRQDAGRGAGWGAAWGFLFDLLFFAPLLGAAAGAAIGGSAGALNGVGIRKEDLERIRESITPGSSALFAVTDGADLDRLVERVHGLGGHLVTTNLTDEERATLLGAVD
ncbi:MAG TPA: DUF1269 domain-containing protein [Micrococcales bacterium]|uniref:DUF1269 domain-containing protein n=1 Tax=Miniimonas arenae TaxID=676201 RepID=UPI000ECCE9A7|nr:DUF1269 domain-containing protein [Miniimonas arenae]HCX84214.1 DUF1269 domain-containing protein [Micrococcales bacterium]